jgi:hypothetical protein
MKNYDDKDLGILALLLVALAVAGVFHSQPEALHTVEKIVAALAGIVTGVKLANR